ncbi:MAG TPA: BTAD domain-containing putative transcriptional regulator, partial [Chloroflexota bacterium]|nr:BTAD domain-containing putative transcriptional regulator [Chloroflexota bacterium]
MLGPPRISWAGEPLLLPRRQARALLYHLAAVPQPVPRDRLCFLLWPDVSDATARRSLTVVLNHIRRALPLGDTLTVEGDAVGLDRLRLWTDVAVLGDVTARATRERHLDRLSEATRLYRGPFLDGFTLPEAEEYEAWVEAERQAWERRFLEALAFLAEGYAEQGDHRAAIGAAQRYLATDELA